MTPSLDKVYEQIAENFEDKMDSLEELIRVERAKGRKLLKKLLHETQKESAEERIMVESLS